MSERPEHQKVFFENLGYAIGTWQHVEMQLFRIYSRLVRCENYYVASAAFHSIINFNARLGMTDAAASVAFASDEAALKRWVRLEDRCNKRSKMRNKLAHFIVMYGINKPISESGPFLTPSIYDVRGGPLAGRKQIDVNQLKAIARSFEKLADDLRLFADSLPAPAALPGTIV